VAAGRFKATPSRIFGFAEIEEAHKEIEESRAVEAGGKSLDDESKESTETE
jgi:hypothetical protein